MNIVWADTETGSECDLKAQGVYRYAEHPSTHIQLFSFIFDDEDEVHLWSPRDGEPMPHKLKMAFANPQVVFYFHNAQFDRILIEYTLGIKIPINRYRCIMAHALSHSLPGALESLGDVLGVRDDAKKIKDGRRLVLKFCKPKKQKDGSLVWSTPETDPEDWAKYKEYCKMDTFSMREVARKMPSWNYPRETELALWILDQEMNDRGMQIDMELVRAAVGAVEEEQKLLARQAHDMTSGAVEAATQRDAMLAHILEEYGVQLPDMKKSTMEKAVDNPEFPAPLRDLIQVRLSASTSSTAKYKKLIMATGSDSRLRGTVQYCGASRTGRDAGRIFQPQNLPSRGLLKEDDVKIGIEALKINEHRILGYDTMHLASSALRYAICAPQGKKLVISDLSAIEGRALAYLANEEWKIEAYRACDMDDNAPDLYKMSYAKAFKIDPYTVTKDQRQVGKVLELAMGYAGGVGAFVTFALSFGIDLDELAQKVIPTAPKKTMDEALSFYDWIVKVKGKTYGMSRETFAAVDCLKRLWREGHPATVQLWEDASNAIKMAICTPKKKFYFGNNMFASRSGSWVRLHLPSGHILCYPGMKFDDKGNLEFLGVNQFSRKWGPIKTHGGKAVENLTQAFSRDIFKYGQIQADKAGYKVVLVVHDEIVAEVPDRPEWSAEELERLMSQQPPWASDMPLHAKGFEDYRYHKED